MPVEICHTEVIGSPAGVCSTLAPDEGVSEQQVLSEDDSRQCITSSSDFTQRLPRSLHRRTYVHPTIFATQQPIRWNCNGIQQVVAKRLCEIETDNCKVPTDLSRLRKRAKASVSGR